VTLAFGEDQHRAALFETLEDRAERLGVSGSVEVLRSRCGCRATLLGETLSLVTRPP
jgi:hypothetical protein